MIPSHLSPKRPSENLFEIAWLEFLRPAPFSLACGISKKAPTPHYNRTHKTAIVIQHSKYLNNLVEQDPRAVKRLTRRMLGFKSFWATRCTIAGMEVMHAIRKGQLATTEAGAQTPAEQFYALAV